MSDVDQIRAALDRATLPDWVESTKVEPMVDHAGEPALRITVVVRADREEQVVRDGAALSELSRTLHLLIDRAGVHLYPYTRFVGASEAAA